jgi:hypothetical protein
MNKGVFVRNNDASDNLFVKVCVFLKERGRDGDTTTLMQLNTKRCGTAVLEAETDLTTLTFVINEINLLTSP